jgi:quercetin 2,3-dioxygenase
MWLRPDVPGTSPAYAARAVEPADLEADWRPVASGDHPEAAVSVGTRGATLWVTRLVPGVSRLLPTGPLGHVFVATGTVEVETVGPLAEGDVLRLAGETQLRLTGVSPAEVLVWTMEP